jgi:adenine deaminase
MNRIEGNLIDIHNRIIYPAEIIFENGIITAINKNSNHYDQYIIPGFVDSHIHIESSMLTPFEFAKAAFKFGTVAAVCDPHEIANVLGEEGINFMISNGNESSFKFNWCLPSCVPATSFETSGAVISSESTRYFFENYSFVALAEMMNYPGVVFDDPEVLKKLEVAKQFKKLVDGHAPGLSGNDLKKYIQSGISTDHECSTIEEAIEKINLGMHILIRNGSAAKNYKSLYALVDLFPDKVMFCSDDLHPENLIQGHINKFILEGLEYGLNLFNLLQAACINPVKFYNLPVGMLRVGDKADFCVIEDLETFFIKETWIDGVSCFNHNSSLPESEINFEVPNNFKSRKVLLNEISVINKRRDFKTIAVTDGSLVTNSEIFRNISSASYLTSNTEWDVLKLVVVNRYQISTPSVAFVKNFGLKKGAIACSVAHDSHNIIAVGVDDTDILFAINKLMEYKGGIIAVENQIFTILPLPVAGLISVNNAETTANLYESVNAAAKSFGTTLNAPFMTLSFLSLLVIPELKLSDKGLFDSSKFEFTSLFV